jgi:hypothetical protein
LSQATSHAKAAATPVGGKAAKPQKLAPAKNVRSAPKSSPPNGVAKTRLGPKVAVAKVPGTGPIAIVPQKAIQNEGSGVRALPIEDRNSRAGVAKTELKAKFAKLSAVTGQIAGLKRAINKTFFDIGLLLNQIRDERLFEVKGYGSFESFVERELDINKVICLRVARVAEALHRDQALAAGLERATAAVAALDGEVEMAAVARPAGSPAGAVPFHKQ